MQKINSDTGLRDAIILLEAKRSAEELALREHLRLTYESIKPINLIRSTYEEVVASKDLKDDLINTSVGLAVGYVSKTLFEGVSHSPLRKLMGTVLLFGITNAVRKNPEAIKSLSKGFFNILRSGLRSRETSGQNVHDIN
jgi:hypothetical protein